MRASARLVAAVAAIGLGVALLSVWYLPGATFSNSTGAPYGLDRAWMSVGPVAAGLVVATIALALCGARAWLTTVAALAASIVLVVRIVWPPAMLTGVGTIDITRGVAWLGPALALVVAGAAWLAGDHERPSAQAWLACAGATGLAGTLFARWYTLGCDGCDRYPDPFAEDQGWHALGGFMLLCSAAALTGFGYAATGRLRPVAAVLAAASCIVLVVYTFAPPELADATPGLRAPAYLAPVFAGMLLAGVGSRAPLRGGIQLAGRV